ncbi:unnamed protein product [Cuscuta epithymum]|uniref:MSP domain-containing protein n=1 Tax=Cuscuta epithymum TaxID=186058 RepID=A0AAV0CT05_9ASTE|nr:unnamed protein product [Cuscuta epithymum]
MTGLLIIQPHDLKFTFELLKQSSCSVTLTNTTAQCVAFKVKTTSPKKYCVTPNIGIIKPNSTINFRVTMQAQRTAPVDMQCKDKFLIQSTIVPHEKMEDKSISEMFTKDKGKYIQENKLRVILISPPQSPVLQPVNGVLKEDSPDNSPTLKEKLQIGVENLPPSHEWQHTEKREDTEVGARKEPRFGKIVEVDFAHPKPKLNRDEVAEPISVEVKETTEVTFSKSFEEMKAKLGVESVSGAGDMQTTGVAFSKNFEELTTKLTVNPEFSAVQTDSEESKPKLGVEPRPVEYVGTAQVLFPKDSEKLKEKFVAGLRSMEDVDTTDHVSSKDIEELKEKLGVLNIKLIKAEETVSKLNQEKEAIAKEKETLMQERVLLRRKTGSRKVQVGFPPLFVCMVALVGLTVGFLLRS